MGVKIPATMGMLTRNSGQTLRKALESVQEFDDIVICDGGSSDDTLAIAHEFGARILSQDKRFLDPDGRLFDYGGARNQMLDAAKHAWFFFLDSDEYCGPDLIEAMRAIVKERGEEGAGAFWVNRKYVLENTPIDYASTYPNRQMRFFSRNSVNRFIKQVHERIELKTGVRAEFLGGSMYVPFTMDIPGLRAKWDHQIAVEVARRGHVTLREFAKHAFDAGKVSLLWSFRLVRDRLLRSGTHMPFRFEMERHRFHFKLLAGLWSIVRGI